MKSILNKVSAFILALIDALFNPAHEKKYPWLTWGWLGGLYLVGAWLWKKFFNGGSIPFDFHDWAEISAARVAFVRDAVMKGVLPLHMSETAHLRGVTDRFMSVPDVMLSPQMLLSGFMEVGVFILFNVLLLYTLGALGLFWLRKRFAIGLAPFTLLFLLFNFNGNIQSHFSVGHINYTGYFLFPWLLALLFKLLDGERSWRWVTLTSLLMFFIFLQGSFHQYIWALLFLGFLAVTSWKHFVPLFKAMLFSVLLSMVRILPPALLYGAFDDDFLGGYPTLLDLWNGMVSLVFPKDALAIRNVLNPTLGWWEFDLYVGFAGALFLIAFGVFAWLKKDRLGEYTPLAAPVVILSVLSIGSIYQLLKVLPIPLIFGERVSARIITLPFVFILFFATLALQRWLQEHPGTPPRLAVAGLVFFCASDLWQHLKIWQVTAAAPAFPVTPVNLAIKVVANHADPPYFNMLIIGAIVSGLSLLVLLFFTWRERKSI